MGLLQKRSLVDEYRLFTGSSYDVAPPENSSVAVLRCVPEDAELDLGLARTCTLPSLNAPTPGADGQTTPTNRVHTHNSSGVYPSSDSKLHKI